MMDRCNPRCSAAFPGRPGYLSRGAAEIVAFITVPPQTDAQRGEGIFDKFMANQLGYDARGKRVVAESAQPCRRVLPKQESIEAQFGKELQKTWRGIQPTSITINGTCRSAGLEFYWTAVTTRVHGATDECLQPRCCPRRDVSLCTSQSAGTALP